MSHDTLLADVAVGRLPLDVLLLARHDEVEFSTTLLFLLLCLLSIRLALVLLFGHAILDGLQTSGVIATVTFVGSVSDICELLIELYQRLADGQLHSFCNRILDKRSGSRSDQVVQEVVLGVTNLELQVVNLNVACADLEDRVLVGCRLELDLSAQSLTANNDIGKTMVRQLGETRLLLEEEGNVTQIHLDLAEANGERVLVVITHVIIRAKLEVVARLNLDKVREKILEINSQVFNDNIESLIRVFCTGDWNVTNGRDDIWDDYISQVVDQVWLVLEVTIAIESKRLDEFLYADTQLLVEWVFVVCVEEVFDRVEEVLAVTSVSLVPEMLAAVDETLSVFVALVFHDVALV